MTTEVTCPACKYSPQQEARYTPETDMPISYEDQVDFFQVLGCKHGFIQCPECQHEFKPRKTGDV